MARPLVFATRNRGKLVELRALLPGVDVLSIDEAEVRLGRAIHEVSEDADTFAGNAIKKAREVAAATGLPALADDSGLEVDALAGAPGVFSARYAGEGAGDAANTAKLLVALAGVPPERRTARFRSVLAFADPSGPLGSEVITGDGVAEGIVLDAPRGTGGFGYDPVFYFPPLAATFAELGVGPKNDLSHRAQAMRAIAPRLLAYLATALSLAVVVACSSPARDTTETTVVVTDPPVAAKDAEPPHVDPPRVTAIGVGEHVSCALLEAGEVRCWGAARLGFPDQTRPTSIGLADVVSLAVGPRHACVARADGSVWCWGDNRDGQLGDGTTTERTAPTKVELAASIVEVVAGGHHTCARDAAGAVWCWGHAGAVGHKSTASANLVPGRVAKLTAATRLIAGADVTCAFVADAPPRCWGFNTAGLLGARLGPVLAAVESEPLARAREVAIGFRHTCLIQTGEEVVYCAGTGEHGQLGDHQVPDDARCDIEYQQQVTCTWRDPVPPRPAPDPRMPNLDLPPPPPPAEHTTVFAARSGFVPVGRVTAVALGVGDRRSCAVTTDAQVACWGQLYANDWSHRTPAIVPGSLGAIAVATSHEHACAVMKDRSVTCWGFNRSGELGDGTITDAMIPSATATPVRW